MATALLTRLREADGVAVVPDIFHYEVAAILRKYRTAQPDASTTRASSGSRRAARWPAPPAISVRRERPLKRMPVRIRVWVIAACQLVDHWMGLARSAGSADARQRLATQPVHHPAAAERAVVICTKQCGSAADVADTLCRAPERMRVHSHQHRIGRLAGDDRHQLTLAGDSSIPCRNPSGSRACTPSRIACSRSAA